METSSPQLTSKTLLDGIATNISVQNNLDNVNSKDRKNVKTQKGVIAERGANMVNSRRESSSSVFNDVSEKSKEGWTTARTKSNTEGAKPLGDVMAEIAHKFGVNFIIGGVTSRGAAGQYNTANNGIRLREANNLTTFAHEIGHAIDNKYQLIGKNIPKDVAKELVDCLGEERRAKYKKGLWEAEGFAEYTRLYLTNRDETEVNYPAATNWLFNSMSQADKDDLVHFADLVNAALSNTETATDAIKLREEKRPDSKAQSSLLN